MPTPAEDELLDLNQQLLDAIAAADWATYEALCDPALTAFEPEARGHLVEGMDFHRYYFDLGPGASPRNTTMSSPKVLLMGDVGVVICVRLIQWLNETGTPVTSHFEETRVWQRQGDAWKHVHFHRSRCE